MKKIDLPKLSVEEKKMWQGLADRRFKPFMVDMDRLEVAARVDFELVHPHTGEVIVAQTLMSKLWKKQEKKK